jgi:hypothetical protein
MSTDHPQPQGARHEQDEQLSRQVADSLERSLDNLDELTLAQLARARKRALVDRAHKRQVIGGLALAASVAALVVVPMAGNFMGTFDPVNPAVDSLDAGMSYLEEDPQMLLDMDMLLAIGESEIES